MSEKSLDGFLVSKSENVTWLTRFAGSFGMVLVTKSQEFLITDSRYAEKAKSLCENSDTEFVLFDQDFTKTFAPKISGKIGIEDSATLAQHKQFQSWLANAETLPQSNVIEQFRSVKTAEEIEKTRIAAAHVDEVLGKIPEILKTGITEKEVCFHLENLIRDNGRFGIAFDSIVAFGEHSAIPHHTPTDRKLTKNEPILIDCGAVYEGYHSDITRNFWFGDTVDPAYKKAYEQLLEIQSEANEKCVSGAKAAEIDAFVRKSLGNSQEFFTHSLGHGTGLEIHELPNLSSKSEAILETGNIITCEPGLYFPGKWGIRIEDQLVVKNSWDFENILTKFSKRLVLIKD